MVISSPSRSARQDGKRKRVGGRGRTLNLSTIQEKRGTSVLILCLIGDLSYKGGYAARLERKIALRAKKSGAVAPMKRRGSGSGAVGGSGGCVSEHEGSVLTRVKRDSTGGEEATLGFVNAHVGLHGDERTGMSTPLADTSSSIDVSLKPSFDLLWVKSELYDKFACELYVRLYPLVLCWNLTFRLIRCTNIMCVTRLPARRIAS